MKKIILSSLVLLLGLGMNIAAEGDTTIVTAHENTELSWYEAYDDIAVFPDDEKTYRKITMEFILGKYACDGYNPSNAGEGPGQTGWCGDWDYDVHIFVQTEDEKFVELGRIITPYANSNWPRTPLDWTHAYKFDVTDYYPILQGEVPVRIFYAGWSGGFTGKVKFNMIEGIPPRDVVKIDPLWEGDFPYGNSSNPINDNVGTKTLTMPTDATAAEMNLFITGHGGDNTQNCAEFCKKWYRFRVNGVSQAQVDIWRDDCGDNFLYPQSGTWVYERGNWCPGDLVRVNKHKVPASVQPGDDFDVRLEFQSYTSPANQASYKLGASMVYLKDFNRELDAGIEEIISPNLDETYFRQNPICGSPVIKVKNFGSETISSIQFKYGVTGGEEMTYTWNSALLPLQEAEVSLLPLDDLMNMEGEQEFYVEIVEVNGEADEDIYNNRLATTFEIAPKWDGGHIRIEMRVPGNIQGYTQLVNWKITDLDGQTLFSRNGTQALQTYKDTINLEDGCYKLEVDASYIGYGMNFMNAFTKGFIRVYNMVNNQKFSLPKTEFGATSFEGNFGNGFTQYFTVVNGTLATEEVLGETLQLQVYPNPVADQLFINVRGNKMSTSKVELRNMLGERVGEKTFEGNSTSLSTSHLSGGTYFLVFTSGEIQKVQKIVVAK